jgi:hypothetical protein
MDTEDRGKILFVFAGDIKIVENKGKYKSRVAQAV